MTSTEVGDRVRTPNRYPRAASGRGVAAAAQDKRFWRAAPRVPPAEQHGTRAGRQRQRAGWPPGRAGGLPRRGTAYADL